MRRLSFTSLLVVALAACSPFPAATEAPDPAADAVAGLPALADLEPGWSLLRPGGETICALGTDYGFFVRPAPAGRPGQDARPGPSTAASSGRLVIYLQGGGACWNGDNCDPESHPTYSRDVDETDDPAADPVGIFDFDNPANPLAGDSFVMIPYCTGDVHLGDRVATYPVEPEPVAGPDGAADPVAPYEVTIHHKGYVNAMAAIEWAFANFDSPAEVLVTGGSGGSIPAPFYGQVVAAHYPRSRVTVLGDAAGSYRREEPEQVDPTVIWDTLSVLRHQPGYEHFTAGEVGYHDLYIVAGRKHPEMRLYEYDAAHDAVQAFFLRLSGAGNDDPAPLIHTNQAEIRAAIPNFASFIAGGWEHTILGRRAFYQYEVAGRLFRDWFAALVAGEEVGDVECGNCDRAEVRFDDADRRIVARVIELLTDESGWKRPDDGVCPEVDEVDPEGDSALSLGCAVEWATTEALGEPTMWSAARLAIESGIVARVPETDMRHPLRDYNNRPETNFAAIQSLLAAVEERVSERVSER